MIYKLNLTREFETNTCRLTYLSKKSHTLYEDLRDSLKLMRKMGFSSIGNPVLELENKVLTLFYTTMQHQTNCECYHTLISGNAVDEDLRTQLSGLYQMTNILSVRYYAYLAEWMTVKNQHKKGFTASNRKLSISA